eukprot:Rmarinus@m.29539
MPCTLKVRVIAARDLPVMDKASELTDAYVEVRFADTQPQRTEIKKRTLSPTWNQDFRIEVNDDCDLQDEPLRLGVWDRDIYSADDIVGLVVIDLNCTLMGETSDCQLSGWFPIHDSMKGVRGELAVVIKLDFVGDRNPFKDSSAGVPLIASDYPPCSRRIQHLYGFVEELVVDDDPEYHWKDLIRTSRTANEKRQMIFFRLSGRLRRQLGRKVLELGGDAVMSYRETFDVEGDSGVVARGYGTCVRLAKVGDAALQGDALPFEPPTIVTTAASACFVPPANRPPPIPTSPTVGTGEHESSFDDAPRREDDSPGPVTSNTNIIQLREVQLLTLRSFHESASIRIAGVVSAKAVKLLGGRAGEKMQEVRDSWWSEVRDEIKAHCRSLGCSFVVGYAEEMTIEDDLAVLSATGTAAVLRWPVLAHSFGVTPDEAVTVLASAGVVDSSSVPEGDSAPAGLQGGVMNIGSPKRRASFAAGSTRSLGRSAAVGLGRKAKANKRACRACHLPNATKDGVDRSSLAICRMCGERYVPEVLLTTIEMPDDFPCAGEGRLVEARICRAKGRQDDDRVAAHTVSEVLPFIEYDLHRMLTYKLKVYGLNAVFGLRFKIAVGEQLIVVVASGMGIVCPALPVPPILTIAGQGIDRQLELFSLVMSASQHHNTESCRAIHEYHERARLTALAGPGRPSSPRSVPYPSAKVGDPLASLPPSTSCTDASGSLNSLPQDTKLIPPLTLDQEGDVDPVRSPRTTASGLYKRRRSRSCSGEADSVLTPSSPLPGNTVPATLLDDSAAPSPCAKAAGVAIDAETVSPAGRASGVTRTASAGSVGAETPSPVFEDIPRAFSGGSPSGISPARSLGVDQDADTLSVSSSESSIGPTIVTTNDYDDRRVFQLEVDDIADEAMIRAILESALPKGCALFPTAAPPGGLLANSSNLQFLTTVVSEHWSIQNPSLLNCKLHDMYNNLYRSLFFKLRSLLPCTLCGVQVDVQLMEAAGVQLIATAMAVLPPREPTVGSAKRRSATPVPELASAGYYPIQTPPPLELATGNTPPGEDLQFPLEEAEAHGSSQCSTPPDTRTYGHYTPQGSVLPTIPTEEQVVMVTPLAAIPGTRIELWLGRVSLHYIRETHADFNVNAGRFTQTFLSEVYAIARAHANALGANAITSFSMNECMIIESGDQVYGFISLSGDAVLVRKTKESADEGLRTLISLSTPGDSSDTPAGANNAGTYVISTATAGGVGHGSIIHLPPPLSSRTPVMALDGGVEQLAVSGVNPSFHAASCSAIPTIGSLGGTLIASSKQMDSAQPVPLARSGSGSTVAGGMPTGASVSSPDVFSGISPIGCAQAFSPSISPSSRQSPNSRPLASAVSETNI